MAVGVVKSTLEDHWKLSFHHLPDQFWLWSPQNGVLAKKVDFWSKTAIFWSKFKKIAVVRYIFPLPEGHIGRWSRQKYSRGPLETFIPSFTRLILAVEPTKWIFGQKGRFFVKNSQNRHFLVKIQKNEPLKN